MSFLKNLLDGNEREVSRLRKVAVEVTALEPQMKACSDDDLRAKTAAFRERLKPLADQVDALKEEHRRATAAPDKSAAKARLTAAYEALEAELMVILPEAFAAAREASVRTLKMRHYDVQLIAGMVLHQGRVAELATGEGKTLAATLALYLNALTGKGSHLVTTNDYLAKRDAVWMAPIFNLLGLSVGVIQGSSPQFAHGSAWRYVPGLEAEDPHWNELTWIPRAECYQLDVLYGTNAEFGFDYLRDNMTRSLEDYVQADLHFAIVDEMDSILIDEARTPLIISGMPETGTVEMYRQADRAVAQLKLEQDYTLDEKAKNALLTEDGVQKVEQILGINNLADDVRLMHHITAALRARYAYRRDIEYVVKDDQVIIVDEFTGRLMFGRRYSDGLHQAIEAKEGVRIQEETLTVATITIQNYFRLYHKLAGMTGTAKTEENEIRKIYGMDVVVVPTNLPMIRRDQADVVYKTQEQKFRALVLDVLQKHVRGQPVLVGTRSIEVSERLSQRLELGERLQLQALIYLLRDRLVSAKGLPKDEVESAHARLNTALDELDIPRLGPVARLVGIKLDVFDPENVQRLEQLLELNGNREVLLMALENGIPHAVLNAKYHEREAEIIAEAGRKHAVTIATNMAGRGVDIMLGGKIEAGVELHPTESVLPSGIVKTYPTRESAEVAELGGLAIVGSERHESRRIDRQLRGRSGRQGDPGESRFYLSLEDELWRLFGDRGRAFLGGWPEYECLEANILTKAIERAQRKVEEHHFGQRKHTLEYDDVMNVHREVIYRQRREILEGADLRDTILDHAYEMVSAAIQRHCSTEDREEWELRALYDELDLVFDVSLHCKPADLQGKTQDELQELLYGCAEARYVAKEEEIQKAGLDPREVERSVSLQVIDDKWVHHLTDMDYLREGVWMRGFEQRDPLVAYKKEAFEMFNVLQESILGDIVNFMFHVHIQTQPAPPPPPPRRLVTPVDPDGDLPLNGGAAATPARPGIGAGAIGPGGGPKRVGRNDPCPCGSGKKYKFCHLKSGGL